MNVFVLCTGRCGSLTFTYACKNIKNYTSEHESKVNLLGSQRLVYPENHIEVDNRLSWFLGRLDEKYDKNAFYVHLRRNIRDTSLSLSKRTGLGSILCSYANGIYIKQNNVSNYDVALDYCNTVDKNIQLFLKDKPNKMEIWIENIKTTFPLFWKAISAEGNLDKALDVFNHKYHSS